MIGRITGTLLGKNPPHILVDVHGVGYEIDVPMSTFYNLPDLKTTVSLYTHFVVREDAELLYGFLTDGERKTFRLLIKINGVGPRTALSILSGLSVQDLAQAVQSEDAALLTRVPGIGKKTAERLVLELKGKFDESLAGSSFTKNDARSDVVSALTALGYSEKEARNAAKELSPTITVTDGIREALKVLSR